MAIKTVGLRKCYGDDVALAGLDLEIEPGSFAVLTGPPKCGKSVLFRLLVGLEKADAGQILLDGEDITNNPPADRRIGYVPQSFALYPHLSVRGNIAYPMALAKADKREIDKQVDRAAEMLSITHLLDKTPDLLSGGEKQRTALARGLLKQAKVFVLDDPLVGLDYKLRERLMDDLKDLRREIGATFIYGTNDSIESLRLASTLVVMGSGGQMLQSAGPMETYARPAHTRVMELVGFPRANLIDGTVADGIVRAGPLKFTLDAAGADQVTVGFRPEDLSLSADTNGDATATVQLVEDLGSELVVHVDAGGLELTSACAVGQLQPPALGDEVGISVQPSAVHFFAADTGMALAG